MHKIKSNYRRFIVNDEVIELIGYSILLTLLIIFLIFLIIRGIKFSNRFSQVISGMSYKEVITIVGSPDEEVDNNEIKTCVWKRAVLRGWTISYTVTFKYDIVLTVLKS